jgi:hypothetical protein
MGHELVAGVEGLGHLVERSGRTLRSLIVDGVETNTVEPGREARAVTEGGKTEPRTDERLLDGVGGFVRRSEQARGQREEPVLVPVHELVEGPAVAILSAPYERSVRIIHA